MNPDNFSSLFSNHQKMISQLMRTVNSSQMEKLAKQLQVSHSFVNSIPKIDYSKILPKYSFISESTTSQIIKLVNFPQAQFAEDVKKLLHSSQLFRNQALENQAVFNQIHADLIQDFKPVLDASNSLQAIYDDIRLTELTIFSQAAQSPAFSKLSQSLLISIQNPLAELEDGFLDKLSALLSSVAHGQDSPSNDGIISEFEDRFADHISDIKRGRVSQAGIAQIVRDVLLLFAFIISLINLQGSMDQGKTLEGTQQILIQMNEQIEKQSDSLDELEKNTDEVEEHLESVNKNLELTNRHLETLGDLGERLISFAEQAGGSPEEAIILVTKHPSVIRTEPSKNGAIITRIYPNQLVEQLKREKDWVYVEYFDYSEGLPKTGWVYRRNLILPKE